MTMTIPLVVVDARGRTFGERPITKSTDIECKIEFGNAIELSWHHISLSMNHCEGKGIARAVGGLSLLAAFVHLMFPVIRNLHLVNCSVHQRTILLELGRCLSISLVNGCSSFDSVPSLCACLYSLLVCGQMDEWTVQVGKSSCLH